jgi:hypothetical protein
MPSRAELNARAYALGFDAATIPNDSKLEQKVLWLEKNFTQNVTGTAPTTTLTSSGTAGNNETFTIGNRTYTLKTTLTGAANEVLIGVAATNTLDNIKEAINGTGTPGTNYTQGTLRHDLVTAGAKNATTLVIAATDTNVGGSIASTETMANFAFTGATLSAGTLGSVTVTGAGTRDTFAGIAGDENTSL